MVCLKVRISKLEERRAKDYKQVRLLAQQALATLEKLDKLAGLEEYGIFPQDELYRLVGASPLDELIEEGGKKKKE